MKNMKQILHRTGAALLSTLLCVSAFTCSASAESTEKAKPQTQQIQQAKPKLPIMSKENDKAGKKGAEVTSGIKKKPGAEKNGIKKTPGKNEASGQEGIEAAENEEKKMQIAQFSVGSSVIFTVTFAEDKETQSGKEKTGQKDNAETPVKGKGNETDSSKSGNEKTDAKDVTGAAEAKTIVLSVELPAEMNTNKTRTEQEKPADGEKADDTKPTGKAVLLEKENPLTYIWQVDKNDGKGWDEIPDANNASYTLSKVTNEQDGWKYRCVISWGAEHAESETVVLQVVEPASHT